MKASPGDRRNGFSLIELVVVALVMSVLAALVVPNVRRALLKARAADLVGELKVVEVASRSYLAEHHAWPPDRNRGRIPPGLDEFLPDGFSLRGENYTLDYDNWLRNGRGFVGVTVITQDEDLGLALLDLLGGNVWTNGRDKFTWVIEWGE